MGLFMIGVHASRLGIGAHKTRKQDTPTHPSSTHMQDTPIDSMLHGC